MTTVSDIERLIGRVALGDRRAFSALYAATSAKLFGVALRILDNRSEAEDAVQEVYVKVWHNAASYQSGGFSPMTWLITIARNHAIDRLRARRAILRATRTSGHDDADILAELADLSPDPEARAIAASEAGRIAACLELLPPDRSDAVRRAYLEGETYAELSHRYAVPLNTVRTWLRRSLIKLRECLSS